MVVVVLPATFNAQIESNSVLCLPRVCLVRHDMHQRSCPLVRSSSFRSVRSEVDL